MALFLGILIFSFIINSIAIVPFIDLLYRLHLTAGQQKISAKINTPIGGGILIIFLVVLLYALIYPLINRFGVFIHSSFPIKEELHIIFFTFISFGLMGLFEDIIKIFRLHQLAGYFRFRRPLQLLLSTVVALLLYTNLQISIFNLPFVGVINLGWTTVPIFAAFIFLLTRGFDITDGLDGLASGILLVCLVALWSISVSALDTPISTFLALWIGSLIAFLYFNVYPARIWLGTSGGLSFGSTLAVTGLLTGKPVAITVIGALFLVEALVQYSQLAWTAVFKRPLFPDAPLHAWLKKLGWPEPKIVLRAWLVSCLLALLGLWLSLK